MSDNRLCDLNDEHCITCSDEGVPMRVLRVHGDSAACCDEARARHHVAVDLVAPVSVGDELLVHAGVALRRLAPSTPTGA